MIHKLICSTLKQVQLNGLLLSLLGFALVPLWWVVGNRIDEFNFYFILFANAVALGSVAIESGLLYFLIQLCKSRKPPTSWMLPLCCWLVFGWVNIWTFGVTTLDLKFRYSLSLALALAVGCSVLALYASGKRLLKYFSIAIVAAAFVNGLLINNSNSNTNIVSGSKESVNKRNIYVLVFDSLVSEEAYKVLYGQDKTPWSSYLREKNFNVIDNARAPGDYTRASFESLFSFGSHNAHLRMTGLDNSVYQYAHDNGYKTAFLADNSYFGVSLGPQLNYLYPTGISDSICFFAPTYFIFGVCNIFLSDPFLNNEPLLNQVSSFINSRDSQLPWLSTVYIWYPGHSPGLSDYMFDGGNNAFDWKMKFVKNVEASTYVIDRVVGEILKNDSDPIIIVMGDHGSWNFRGIDKPTPNISAELLELDKFGITFAIYPKNLCNSFFYEKYATKFLFLDLHKCGAF